MFLLLYIFVFYSTVIDATISDVINTVGFYDTTCIDFQHNYAQNYGIKVKYNYQQVSCYPGSSCTAKFIRIFDEFIVYYCNSNKNGVKEIDTEETDLSITINPSYDGSMVILDDQGLYIVDGGGGIEQDLSARICSGSAIVFECLFSNGCKVKKITLDESSCPVNLNYIGYLGTGGLTDKLVDDLTLGDD